MSGVPLNLLMLVEEHERCAAKFVDVGRLAVLRFLSAWIKSANKKHVRCSI